MRLPSLSAVVERRLLVNYRVEPAVIAKLLPPAFEPLLAGGWAVAGICLIRLGSVRPPGLPALVPSSENAAHRIAVQWQQDGERRVGVWIPRRDTSSALTVLLGGRVFPGEHTRARFDVRETDSRLRVGYRTVDGSARVDVEVDVVDELVGSELFADLQDASTFFRLGAQGFSATRRGRAHDGLELSTDAWAVSAGAPRHCTSSWFDDPARFPPGSVALDSALVMRQVPVLWRALPELAATAAGT